MCGIILTFSGAQGHYQSECKSEIVLGLIINKITSNLSLICKLIVQLMMYLTTTTFMNFNLKRTKKISMIKLMLCYFVISVVYLFFNDYLLTFLRHQIYLFVSLFMLYVL
jgi:hypothetical protein